MILIASGLWITKTKKEMKSSIEAEKHYTVILIDLEVICQW